MGDLYITINSFSYKKGLPDDPSGNGGGHVFDCRCIQNPGLLDEYKLLTGRDAAVISYLKNHSDADRFVENVFEVVRQSIQSYQNKGYTSLMISFGCTGGRHRSVYCAEALAEKIRETFDVSLCVRHQEAFGRDISGEYNNSECQN